MSTAAREIEEDFRLLAGVAGSGRGVFRTWCCEQAAVVLGVSLAAEREVDLAHCDANGIPVLRRRSGGGAVWIGPGTLQYAFALPRTLSPGLVDIRASKRLCNSMLLAGLRAAAADGAAAALDEDVSGDLRLADRKVGGLALKIERSAVLVHGTLLLDADLASIAAALRHPSREPSYRRSRPHADFLENLGAIRVERLEAEVRRLLLALGERGLGLLPARH